MASNPVPMQRAPYATQGYRAVYRREEVNHCPECGHANWLVGRKLAECARCATAMPLAESIQEMGLAAPRIVEEPQTHNHLRAVD